MQSLYLRRNQTETVENHRDKCLSRFISVAFFTPLLSRSTYVSGHKRMYYDGRKTQLRDCIGAVIAAGRLRSAPRVSFDVKHVRHEEYVNNANKTLFIARAAPSLFYHCFLCNLFIPFISRFFSSLLRVKARCILGFVALGLNVSTTTAVESSLTRAQIFDKNNMKRSNSLSHCKTGRMKLRIRPREFSVLNYYSLSENF